MMVDAGREFIRVVRDHDQRSSGVGRHVAVCYFFGFFTPVAVKAVEWFVEYQQLGAFDECSYQQHQSLLAMREFQIALLCEMWHAECCEPLLADDGFRVRWRSVYPDGVVETACQNVDYGQMFFIG